MPRLPSIRNVVDTIMRTISKHLLSITIIVQLAQIIHGTLNSFWEFFANDASILKIPVLIIKSRSLGISKHSIFGASLAEKWHELLRQLYFVVFSFDINILSSFQAPLNLFQEVLIELEQKFPNCLDFWGGLPLMSRHTIFLSRRKSREDNLYYLSRCLHCLHAAAHGPSNPRMSALSWDKWHKLNDYTETLL